MLDKQRISVISILTEKKPDGVWKMTSKDLPGFYLAGKDLGMLERDIPLVIKMLLEKNYKLNVLKVFKPTKPIYIKNPESAPAFESPGTWAADYNDLVPA